ncbi:sulfide:quinone oxidoreductase [Sulfobacillus thermosulfidooxidans DSM 9293]|uniref:Sulfide:quinone oxidoreductase n=1 Tax=Sulfobacillus thermosulfidooxidans (strain DSM 9293 / VKM B-1269 / AT-1) TaxID=929705 RepID=A0A1W1WBP4_SULTA|nr:pyridine nucleotide-disulfide oxidoreductase [Sulfobacillus thermosulfidooxidans]SMC03163.1 sulfide:quinone oxidoreductase [Sulfobacillus thermosulfidooxidans DSM 9293]
MQLSKGGGPSWQNHTFWYLVQISQVLVLPQKVREMAGDAVNITVIDRKTYLLFVPNIPMEVFENRNPLYSMHMPLIPAMKEDHMDFIQGDVQGIDVETQTVEFLPVERLGAAVNRIHYDYLIIAVGARLAYDKIEGFHEYGHTVSDTYYGNRLRHYLYHEYKGGPVAIGSARFHQGTKTRDLVPTAEAACEGPPVEVMLTMGNWLQSRNLGGPDKVTVFTPAEWIAEDAGQGIVHALLAKAGTMGFHYRNNTHDITRITKDGIEFANGPSLDAELKIIFPDWVPHAFMKDLPISDDVGFVITDMTMRNPKYPNVFACGDAAAVTVPKLGILAHMGAEVAARQIAKDVGLMNKELADQPMKPIVDCIGDMGNNKAFYISSNTWYGGNREVFRMGHVPYLLKVQYKEMFFRTKGKVPDWGIPVADFLTEMLTKG